MLEAPPEDVKPPEGEGEEVQEAADDDEDMDVALQQARFGLDRLKVAIRFVQDEVPPYGTRHGEDCPLLSDKDVPPSIDLVRRRALIAAYGLIEREFSPPVEAEREDG